MQIKMYSMKSPPLRLVSDKSDDFSLIADDCSFHTVHFSLQSTLLQRLCMTRMDLWIDLKSLNLNQLKYQKRQN